MSEVRKNDSDKEYKRFIVDERNGCISIRDTEHPEFNNSNGLNQDMPDIVALKTGSQINTGKFVTWDLDPEIIKDFNNRCDFLNYGDAEYSFTILD